jgi:hypothetical protein
MNGAEKCSPGMKTASSSSFKKHLISEHHQEVDPIDKYRRSLRTLSRSGWQAGG